MRSEELSIFCGPLPHPDTLVAYDAIESGLANRIVTMAEEQAHHDHEMESMSLTAGIRQSSRAQWLAFTLALSVAVLACIVALFGAWWLGLFMFLSDVVGFVVVYVLSQRADAVDSDPPADD